MQGDVEYFYPTVKKFKQQGYFKHRDVVLLVRKFKRAQKAVEEVKNITISPGSYFKFITRFILPSYFVKMKNKNLLAIYFTETCK